MPDHQVCPTVRKLTDLSARHLLSEGLIKLCHEHGPSSVAAEAACDEKTIRRARNEENTLSLAFVLNLLDLDDHVLDALFAAKGKMVVPLIGDGADIIPLAGEIVHRIGRNRSPESEGGVEETDNELIATEAENDRLLLACIERRCAIGKAKLRRAKRAAA